MALVYFLHTSEDVSDVTPLLPQHRSQSKQSFSLTAILTVALRSLGTFAAAVVAACLVSHYFDRFCVKLWSCVQRLARPESAGLSEAQETTWSAGSTFAAILVLQISCMLQPAGSLVIDDAINTWRLSPLYCTWDTLAVFREVVSLKMSHGASFLDICVAIGAARYRSFRTFDTWTISGKAGLETLSIQQDIADVRLQSRKRRILATTVGITTLLQYAKVMSIRGEPITVAVPYTLGTIYFTHWFANELLLAGVRLSEYVGDGVAYEVTWDLRSPWFVTKDQSLVALVAGPARLFGGIFVAMLVFGAGTGEMKVGGGNLPSEFDHLGAIVFLFIPLFVMAVCAWPVTDFAEGFGKAGAFLQTWYTTQGLQVVGLVLLFFICFFDEDTTWKAPWTEWIP